MIRIRPGRSWRHNPSYSSELRALGGPDAHDFTGDHLLDVLGIEIDGVDIAAGIGEAPVIAAIDELAAAILRVGEGEPAAQATIGPGPTELVLEPRGAEVLLSLVTLRPPARVLASGLLVDAAKLRSAALVAVQGLVLDLLDASPALEGSALLKRLARSCAALARGGRRRAREWPPSGAAAAGFVVHGGTAPVRVEVQVPAASAARLGARALAPWSPLAPLLGAGAVSLRLGGTPALTAEAPPWLLLRELVREAAALVHAWEAGDRVFTLRAGALELRCDLTTDEARAPAWKNAAAVAPARLAEAIAAAAKAFAERALSGKPAGHTLGHAAGPAKGQARRLAGAARRDASPGHEEPLDDLRAAAASLLAHCRDLRSGALRRAPEAVRAPPPRRAPEPPPTLLAGRVRRLLYRTASQAEVGPILPGGLLAFPAAGVLVLQGVAGLVGISLEGGERLWHLPGAGAEPGAAVRTGAGDLFATEGDALLRVDAATGAVKWRRVMRGGGPRVWAVEGGCARALESGVALVRDAGTLAFRARLDGGAPLHCAVAQGVLLAQLEGGLLLGLDAGGGPELWRRRCGVGAGPLVIAFGHALLVRQDLRGARALIALEATTGEPVWERPLPPGGPETPGPVTLAGELACVLAGAGVQAVDLANGAARFNAHLPWGPSGRLLALDEPQAGQAAASADHPALLAAGPGGAALRLDHQGAQLWSRAPEGGQDDALQPQAAGPALLCAGGPATLIDLASGTVLARPALREVDAAALLPDLSVALHFKGGGFLLLRLATHLSLL